MKSAQKNKHDDDSVVIDVDSGEEIVAEETEISNSSLKSKLKTIRNDLKETKRERDENLAGWQRAKAELVNYRRLVEEEKLNDGTRARIRTISSILPSLDSMESAINSSLWKDMNPELRKGIEQIMEQLKKALNGEGLVSYAVEGETFDPSLHECISVITSNDKEEDHKIAQVLQRGYKLGNDVVRAAKVVVCQVPEEA